MSGTGYSKGGREGYLRAGDRIEMLGKITYPISADEVVFFWRSNTRSGQLPAPPTQEPPRMLPSSADGVPGVAARGRASLGYQLDRVILGKPGRPGSALQAVSGAGRPWKHFLRAYRLHLTLDSLRQKPRNPHLHPAVPCLTAKPDSARARNGPCWGPEG